LAMMHDEGTVLDYVEAEDARRGVEDPRATASNAETDRRKPTAYSRHPRESRVES